MLYEVITLLFAEKQIESGDYLTQEDLEEEIKNW